MDLLRLFRSACALPIILLCLLMPTSAFYAPRPVQNPTTPGTTHVYPPAPRTPFASAKGWEFCERAWIRTGSEAGGGLAGAHAGGALGLCTLGGDLGGREARRQRVRRHAREALECRDRRRGQLSWRVHFVERGFQEESLGRFSGGAAVSGVDAFWMWGVLDSVQGYFTYKKTLPPWTLP